MTTTVSPNIKTGKNKLPLLISGLTAIILTTSCANYRVTLNNNDLIEPRLLFKDFALADAALHTCVEQTISDRKIETASQLSALNCSSAGIATLQGLDIFKQLKYINLSHNKLSSVAPLLGFTALETVDLSSNPSIDCREVAVLRSRAQKLIAPLCEDN